MEYFKKLGVPRGTTGMSILFCFGNVSRETPLPYALVGKYKAKY